MGLVIAGVELELFELLPAGFEVAAPFSGLGKAVVFEDVPVVVDVGQLWP